MEDDKYYTELQNTLRGYDQKLWIIPGLFFSVVALILGNLDYKKILSFSFTNIVLLFLGTIFLFLLMLLFYKAHFFHISIQKKINKFDKIFNQSQDDKYLRRIPLTSMSDRELKDRIKELENDFEVECKFTYIQKWLIKRQVTTWIKGVMWIIFIIALIFFILQIINIPFHSMLK